jgi:hypothetical protein
MPEWFNPLGDWLRETWRQLPSKDAVSLIVSLCSFALAFAGLMYTMRSKRRDATTAARNDLHSCISQISEIRAEREAKQRELGDEFHSAQNVPLRMTLNARTNLYLSKAVLLSTRYRKLDISSFESLLLGAALSDQGRHGASLDFYKRAVRISADPFDKATAQRVYGRALIASAHPRRGRWHMRRAAKLFSYLSRQRGYDADLMNYEVADTYGRLIQIQLGRGYRKKTAQDLIDFRRAIVTIKEPRRRTMEELLEQITNPGAAVPAVVATASPGGMAADDRVPDAPKPDPVVVNTAQAASPGSTAS